jgi:hypothetical protein
LYILKRFQIKKILTKNFTKIKHILSSLLNSSIKKEDAGERDCLFLFRTVQSSLYKEILIKKVLEISEEKVDFETAKKSLVIGDK